MTIVIDFRDLPLWEQTLRIARIALMTTAPPAVLVHGETASGSELVAAALQDRERLGTAEDPQFRAAVAALSLGQEES